MLLDASITRKVSMIFGMGLAAWALVACTTVTPTEVPTEVPTGVPTGVPAATDIVVTETESVPVESGMLPTVDAMIVSGDIVAAGSSTVFPLAEAVALQFKDEGFAGEIKIDSIGSGAGLERFCKTGETDIATSSRHIKDEEVSNCAAINRTPIEFRVGTDALAVVVSSENDFLTDLTLEQLALAFTTANTWKDVDASFPDEPIQRFSPGTDSGTFDYFVEAVLAKDKAPLLNAKNLQLSEDDNVLVQGVEGNPYAIGYFGYAYYQENSEKLHALSIAGVEPSFDSAENNSYKLSRPLYLYSDATVMQEKPQVAAFINYFLTNVNDLVGEVGYFPASDDAWQVSVDNWLKAVGTNGQ